ncbi:PCI domain-containing protein [Suillus bovinus]|uniref:PCI domain-containing protein n=1 Tax=Suillus bovinus TaxID=48563 RepID=UPI001B8624CC|nr:PCI domain-containing protein [Suillus bovinus]KAG2154290.1 PCI domain-containing protein [Suillus bovinus]
MPDVEMVKATDKKDEKKDDKKPERPTPTQEIRANIALIDRAINDLETRLTHRVLRSLTALRKRINDKVLRDAIEENYPKDSAAKNSLLSWLPPAPPAEQSMEVDTTSETNAIASPPPSSKPTSDPVPEAEIYFRLLIIHHLHTSKDTYSKSIELSHETVDKMQSMNRRSMDPIAAKIWFAVERSYELGGELADARPIFLAAQRTASLRHDDDTQASLINRLLRGYLHYNLYDQADKLVSKTTFPASAGNPQYARYHYFLGRIKALSVAPLPQKPRQDSIRSCTNFLWSLELLMGDIPDRSLFRHPVLEKALSAYFDIVKAVRTGSLSEFQTTLNKHAAQFEADKTYTLIVRLRQNVIKTGIRRLSLSYSRISLRDICLKLHLDSEEDAEYIVGKAIRDGVIEGRIVHEKGWMECGSQKDGYGPEASDVFGRRIGYCLDLHNESVKAMRYPLNAHRKELAAAQDAREREKELAKEIQEGDLDDDEGLGDY